MIITELSLTNFRGYENATFTFQPGINLIAGVNGAGKSTALDANITNTGTGMVRLGGMA